ncbi:MAG: hypothetical protein IPG02_02860 [Ignavibacteria bacterium]|nr:hypothetical protein [Ignavibacteria bacterium]
MLFAPSREGIDGIESADELIERFKAYEPVINLTAKGNFRNSPNTRLLLQMVDLQKMQSKRKSHKEIQDT